MDSLANRNELAKLFTGIGAEIGVYRGEYSAEICKYADKLYCVDSWLAYENHPKQYELDEVYRTAKARLKQYNTEIIMGTSMEAVQEFKDGELDFVYIDANHSWEHITQDIYHWSKKVRKGGIVAGHDYFVSDWHRSVVHVLPVVNAYVEAFKISPLYVTTEKMPSWFFVK